MENRKRSMAAVPAGDEKNTAKSSPEFPEIAKEVTDTITACLPQLVHAVRQCIREEGALDDAAHQAEKKAGTARHLEEFAETLKFVLAHKNDLADAAKILSELNESCPSLVSKLL